ncbi:MAG TPA: hypothetical protein VMV91_13715 [Rhodocyclaceae bacterium]|nr:hypothetical protein [Rhodocyclaceae bacterium]
MPVARGFEVLRAALAAPIKGRTSIARERLRLEAAALVRDEHLVEAAYSYRIVPLEAPAAELLRVGGEELHAPWLIPESGQLTALACGVCTVGPRLEARVGELFAQRRASLALALDALGNEMLFAVSRRAQDRMLVDARRRGLSMAGELRAGDPGLALEAQGAVLRLGWAETIGVRLAHGQLMQPMKSTSMVLGVGIDLPPTRWSRCDACPSRQKCGGGGALSAQPGLP